MNLLSLLLILLGIILGVVVGYIVARNLLHQKQVQARQTADDIVSYANKEADNIKKEKLLEAKEENQILKEQAENLNGAEYSALEGVIKSYYSLNEQYKKFSQRTYAFARKANDVAS